MQFCSADPDLEGCVTRSEKDERRINRKKLVDASSFLQKLFRDSAVIATPQNTRVFHVRVKTNKVL